MMKNILIVLIGLYTHCCYGQSGENIVPNAGFEEYSSYPIGWFYTGKHFSTVMKYWSSPTAASPDAFGPKISVPVLWKDKGFGKDIPHNGESMVGITVVGCGDGKPHCREYLQTPLLDALVIGQKYEIIFWVKELDRGYEIEELGISFKTKRTYVDDDIRLDNANISAVKMTGNKEKGWSQMKATIIADEESDYLIIGNFFNDLDSRARRSQNQTLSFGYYHIDDVNVRKIAPILPTPNRKATWEGKELKPPATFTLKNIFFDSDKAILLPRSFLELDKLLVLLQEHPNMVIRINGHTDSDGGEAYNDDLSVRRAEAVESYLKTKKVPQKRLSVVGFGVHKPIADNETEDGKQLNRRVEFTIVSM